TETGSDSEIKNEIASLQDEICFICRYVAGEKLFTVKAVMSQMYDSELDAIHAMTETDICDFKGHLEAAANGIEYSEISEGPDGIRLEFGSERIETFPFRCEILIEVPLAPGHDPMNLYYVDGGDYYSIPHCPVRNVDSAGEHEYLIFTIDRFGSFVYTNQPVDAVNAPMPEIVQPISGQPAPNESATPAASSADTDAAPVPEASDGTAKSHTPALIVVIIAVLSCAGGYFFLRKKKS
ncbi:MAG: hypothetical protein K6E85_02835, partial [Lachnospiraceae bacterium]|nr:hypothetical protein [Lachnospiraceae bacterium]